MVIFAVPIITGLFTTIIGGVTLHLANQNGNEPRPEENYQIAHGEGSGAQGDERKSQEVQGVEMAEMGKGQGDGKGKVEEKKEEEKEKAEDGDGQCPQSLKNNQEEQSNRFRCPLTNQTINHPAELLCGHCFEKSPLVAHLKKTKKCPVCNRQARCSEIYEPIDYKNILEAYKAKKRARKLSHERLIEDFGDDRFQLVFGFGAKGRDEEREKEKEKGEERACSDSECEVRVRKESFSFEDRMLSSGV